jgi:hypothetical protein
MRHGVAGGTNPGKPPPGSGRKTPRLPRLERGANKVRPPPGGGGGRRSVQPRGVELNLSSSTGPLYCTVPEAICESQIQMKIH